MPVSASDPESIAISLRWQNARPVWGFISGVYLAGFVAWAILTIVIVVIESRTPSPFNPWMTFVPLTVIFWALYCAMIVAVFFFLPIIALRLGRKRPHHARPITLAISVSSSLVIWLAFLTLLGFPRTGQASVFFLSSVLCSILGGAIAGHRFWKLSFPPLEDPSPVFR